MLKESHEKARRRFEAAHRCEGQVARLDLDLLAYRVDRLEIV